MQLAMEGMIMRGTPQSTLEQLTQVSRERALSSAESIRLEVAIRGLSRRGERTTKPWGNGDDIKLAVLLSEGFRPPQIALRLGRTERAIWRRIYKLGGQERILSTVSFIGNRPARGSIANDRRSK